MRNSHQKIDSRTDLVPGLIENVDIFQIKTSKFALRTNLTNIEQLAQSIKEKGLLQPIVVRSDNAGFFEIVAGYRRSNACKSLSWRKIPCHMVELDDKEAFEISLIENIQRKTLNPIDEAVFIAKRVQELQNDDYFNPIFIFVVDDIQQDSLNDSNGNL